MAPMRPATSVAPVSDEREPRPALTSLAAGAGCGCKLPPGQLLSLVSQLAVQPDERLLVGSSSSDDAAVFELRDGLALVQSVDFFTPLVDDPYDFGRIAAANALSDLYAMGATPLTALNLVAFPLQLLGEAVLAEMLRGGADVVAAAGAVLAGGHSIDDREPKYGLAVTGLVDPATMLTNAGGRAGDALVLTKPLGGGAIVAARKREAGRRQWLAAAVEAMVALNRDAAQAALDAGAHAMTDVTGYGLLGHLHHLCRESGLAAEVSAAGVPALTGAREALEDGTGDSGGARRNAEWARGFASFAEDVAPWRRRLLADPATSGGLLVAVDPEASRLMPGAVIGRLRAGRAGTIAVR
jgi:selenide, water dikinase